MVKGDTFPHRALLKHLGFRWAPVEKLWHRPVSEQDTLDYICGMLELNEVAFTADASVPFNLIDEEKVRSIRQSMLDERLKL